MTTTTKAEPRRSTLEAVEAAAGAERGHAMSQYRELLDRALAGEAREDDGEQVMRLLSEMGVEAPRRVRQFEAHLQAWREWWAGVQVIKDLTADGKRARRGLVASQSRELKTDEDVRAKEHDLKFHQRGAYAAGQSLVREKHKLRELKLEYAELLSDMVVGTVVGT